jgi:hypothetical protein
MYRAAPYPTLASIRNHKSRRYRAMAIELPKHNRCLTRY